MVECTQCPLVAFIVYRYDEGFKYNYGKSFETQGFPKNGPERPVMSLSALDLSIIAFYFGITIFAGLWCHRRASKNLDDYFLGNRQLPWWLLALSGAAANFDISGTMWQVSILMLFGFRSFNIHWMWAFLTGAFLMSFMARWIRRTGVMTAAELMKVRFGEDTGGRVARSAAAAMVVVFQTFAIGYGFIGAGKFAAPYFEKYVIPASYFDALGVPGLGSSVVQCALVMTIATTAYVIFGGFISVVVTDVLQVIIKNIACVIVAVIAYCIIDVNSLHAKMSPSLLPTWELSNLPAGYEKYQHFGWMVPIWLFYGLGISLGGAGGNYGEQRFLATRGTRDASIAGALWNISLVLRWAMVGGIAFIALASAYQMGDPERALPEIVRDYLPNGFRGFVLAAFIAAYMATFSAVVNSGASMLVNDLIRPFWPSAKPKTLVRVSYGATLALVLGGIWSGFNAESVDKIWNWLLIGLYSSVLIPNMLRWYWWRLNGWGYSIGVFASLALAIVVLFRPDIPEYVYAPILNAVALLGCVFGSLLTTPVDDATIVTFFRRVRPFGWWGPIRRRSGLTVATLYHGQDHPGLILTNVVLGMVALLASYLFPLYLIGHWFQWAWLSFAVCATACFVLYFTWYRRLEDENESLDVSKDASP
jgi:Na+/proline symporter